MSRKSGNGAATAQMLVDLLRTATQGTPSFSDVQVKRSVDTKQIMLPAGMSNPEAIEWLEADDEQQNMMVAINVEIDAFPMDGAISLAKVLKEIYGWTNLVPKPGFFGPTPPDLVEVEVGPGETVQAHWGRLTIPGIKGHLDCSMSRVGKKTVFKLSGQVQKRFEPQVREICEKVREHVRLHSIYRGKAIRINFRDEDGDPKSFEPGDGPKFMDTTKTVESDLIFPKATALLVETALFNPIEYRERLAEMGVPFKAGVLLEGPFGTGKTLLAAVVAKRCVANEITFIYLEDVRDLDKGLAIAEQYSPAVLLSEDLDRIVGLERTDDVNRIVNILDGVNTKHSEVLSVFTTNHVDRINQVILRPGRVDRIIPIRQPDAEAAIRLVKKYGRGLVVADDIDIGRAITPLLGSTASAFREVVERAKLYAVRHFSGKVELHSADLALAAESMKLHMALLAPRAEVKESPAELFVQHLVDELTGALERNNDAVEGAVSDAVDNAKYDIASAVSSGVGDAVYNAQSSLESTLEDIPSKVADEIDNRR